MWRLLFLLIPGAASAGCDALFLSCTIGEGAKTLLVCHSDTHAMYRFGPTGGAAELDLTHPVTKVDLTPWPGIGRTIWEEVIFHQDDFSYLVYGSIQREYPDDENADLIVTQAGGVIVSQDGTEIAHLRCDPGSVDFPWGEGLYAAKVAAGQCYERTTRNWRACP